MRRILFTLCLLSIFLMLPDFASAQSHYQGASGRPMVTVNGHPMQGVHEYHIVMYAQPGNVTLSLPEKTNMVYCRWYDYKNDNKSNNIANINDYTSSNSFGQYRYNPNGYSGYQNFIAKDATFKMPSGNATQYIACDLSAYRDAQTGSNNTITREPTLSYRVVYEIRPAYQIANAINALGTSDYLETHYITAPTGKTITLALNYDASSYFYINNKNQVTAVSSWNKTITNGRFTHTTGSAERTEDVWVTASGKNIAHYIITTKNNAISTAGGNIMTRTQLEKLYTFAGGQNFNGYDGTTPLPWDECSYGFARYEAINHFYNRYYTGVPGTNSTSQTTHASWGEYSLLKTCNGWDLNLNNRISQNNTFLFIDAATAPGVVANLKVSGELCQGAKLIFSAKVADMNGDTQKDRPNLNFEVTGIKTENGVTTETAITTFTTGEINSTNITNNSGKWYQILFEIEKKDDIDYDEYRLRIVNNGNSAEGNDFAIDDIEIWKGRAPLTPYQGQIRCTPSSDAITSVLRINYNNTVTSTALTKFFYQWRDNSKVDAQGKSLPLNLDYVGATAVNGSNHSVGTKPAYGEIGRNLFVNHNTAIQDGDVENASVGKLWENLDALIAAAEAFTKANNTDCFYGYIDENVDGNNVHILYIIHITNKMEKGKSYTAELATSTSTVPTWSLSNNTCGFQDAITVNVPQAIKVDESITYTNNAENTCAQAIHSLEPAIVINLVDNDRSEVTEVKGTCVADWLLFPLSDIPQTYSWDEGQITAAFENFRAEYPNATSVNQLSAVDNFTAEQLLMLQTFAANNDLVLFEQVHYEYLNAQETKTVTLFPIASTATLENGENIPDNAVCLEPMEFILKATTPPTGDLKFGPSGDNYKYDTDEAKNRVAGIRINKNATTVKMPIREMDKVKVTGVSLMPELSTDKGLTEKAIAINNMSGLQQGDNIEFNISELGLSELAEGQEYAIAVNFTRLIIDADGNKVEATGDCAQGMNYFLVKVVPQYAVWTPQGNNTAWNNDNNWSTADAQGKVQGSGFVPMNAYTNTIIAANEQGIYPVLPTSQNAVNETGATPYINYDINYTANSSNDIYFEVGTMMGNQQTLDYNDAYVDMALPSTRWTLAGMPMQSMVSGDFNVPTSEMDGHAPFTVTKYDGNYTVQFWQNLYYNTTAYNVGWSGVDNVTNVTLLENTYWTSNFNGVRQLYTPGTAAAVWPVDDRKNDADNYDVVVSLPGKETTLYYYSYGNPTGIGESIDRTNNTKLAYPQTTYTLNSQANDDYVVFGNPTMAYIDLNSFLTRNSSVLANEYTYWYGNVNTLDWTSYTNNGSANATALPSEIVEGYLAPMRGIMLKKANASATSVTITIDPTDLTTTPTAAPATPTASSLYITAKSADHISHASVVEGSDADNGYNANEDAKAIRIDNDFTPSVLYTVGGEKALAINSLSNINNVPVAVLTEQTTSATLSFEGADSFNGKLYLHDAQANTSTLITNEDKITITTTRSGEPIRYFIQKVADETTAADVTTNDGINIFVQPDGSITVASNDMLTEVNVYNGAGQRILHQTANDQFVGLSLPAGVYAIQAVSTNESKTQKVVVK